jgi:CSLREA domain-containing protein
MISNGNGVVTDTVGFDVTTAPEDHGAYSADWYRDVLTGAGSVLGLPNGMQAARGWYFVLAGSDTIIDHEAAVNHWLRNGQRLPQVAGNSYEIRFTSADNKAIMAFTTETLVDVPFELWFIGSSTLDDDSDDIRMIPWILDVFDGLADEIHGGQNVFNFGLDQEASGGNNDPYSDWIYWRMPSDDRPGEAGYNQFVADATAGTYDLASPEHLARTVIMNWDQHQNESAPGAGDGPVNAMPESGTTFRISFNDLAVGPTFIVTNTGDSGAGSLRNAIELANLTANIDASTPDTIKFDIPGAAPHTIQLLSALPEITDPVVIDGTTEPDFVGRPIIELDGSSAGDNVSGFTIRTGNSTVRGLVINRFNKNGIHLVGSDGNHIEGNYIGTDVTGTAALGNSGTGIVIEGGTQFNTIGGNEESKRNVISGNGFRGVWLNSSNNTVSGNYIGTDVTGTATLGNSENGVVDTWGVSSNTIGGEANGERNIISGNGEAGIWILGISNTISGNYIGTDVNGTADLGNRHGVIVRGSNNIIGGTTAGARNVISGNEGDGVGIGDFGSGATANIVQGNYIGTDVTGTMPLGNGHHGVVVDASNNTIGGTTAGAGNVISDNAEVGIWIGNSGTGNVVQGNFIGTDATGTVDLGNGREGVSINGSATNTTVGGTTAGAHNVVSGNGGDGIGIFNDGTTGNMVLGNFIGTDINGVAALGNSQSGIQISGNAANNIIGGTTAGARNIISGNAAVGVNILGSGTTGNLVQGNYIGANAAGTAALGNGFAGVNINSSANNNTIGGAIAGAGNVISGNVELGVEIGSNGADGNVVQGNLIGTDVTGTADLGNGGGGIGIGSSASSNIIGGTDSDAGNTIAYNGSDGVRVVSGTQNPILSNSIFSNTTQGIDLGNNGVTPNDPGDADTGANNLQNFPEIISSFIDHDGNWSLKYHVDSDPANSVYALTVQFFEPDPTGQGRTLLFDDEFSVSDFNNGMKSLDLGKAADLGIFAGSRIVATATDANSNTSEFSAVSVVDTALTFVVNSIDDRSDSNPGDGICDDGLGNCTLRAALEEANAGTTPDMIAFDIPGTGPHTITPESALPTIVVPVVIDGTTEPDFAGTPIIELDGTSAGDSVDGLHITAGNSTVKGLVINRFKGDGIEMRTSGDNVVQGNFIGTDATGTADLGNTRDGVVITSGASHNTIGGTTEGARNVISGQDREGVLIAGAGVTGNLILGNFIGTDVTGTATLGNTRDGVVITSGASHNTIGGTTVGARNVISGNDISGVFIQSAGTTGNLIQGNFIGTDVTGTNALSTNQGVVITVAATGNTIGGTVPGARNLISGNEFSGVNIFSPANTVQGNFIGTDVTGNNDLGNDVDGVFIAGAGVTGNLILGNFIGTDVTGTATLGNTEYGVRITDAPDNLVGARTSAARNLISGNGHSGIAIFNDGATGNLVQGNFIGTDGSGSQDLGNKVNGVLIQFGATQNRIGGTSEGARNIISGNGHSGVNIISSDNTVQGNYLGTDVTGSEDLGNTSYGVLIQHSAKNNLVGGAEGGAYNVISGNDSSGVSIQQSEATGNRILGNYIGTDATGTKALGNSRHGVKIVASASHNFIGGRQAEAGNLIAYNESNGVRIVSGVENAIFSNTMFSNGELAIDLSGDGVTENDPGDADTGPNNLQNFPEIFLAGLNADGALVLTYQIDSDPANSDYPLTVEFFVSDTSGEGKTFLAEDIFTETNFNDGFKVANLGDSR